MLSSGDGERAFDFGARPRPGRLDQVKTDDMANSESGCLLTRKIASIAGLTAEEQDVLDRLPIIVRNLHARQDIVRFGERPSHCCLVLSGFAFRFKMVGDGQRQILNFHVPGDIPDLQSLHLPVMDHTLAALTAMRAGFIPHEALHEVNARLPRIAGALWRNTLIDAAQLRERIVTVGQRRGLGRMAHFLCEMFSRLSAVGLASDRAMTMAITQIEIADALGLTPVHINRMIKELRDNGLITMNGQNVTILDWETLTEVGEFDPIYLHLDSEDRARPT